MDCPMYMALSRRAVTVVLHTFVCFFLSGRLSYAVQSDIDCLKSIKATLEDPLKSLESSWNFQNHTEGFICKFVGIECWHPDENKVLNIRLADMGLKGRFPRGIANCTSLTGLDLSSNNLSGPIPFDISNLLNYVTSLDLSSNRLSGEIPLSLANCTYLNVLKLDNNQLIGQIPLQLGWNGRIKTFSVTNNWLTGPVPIFVNITSDSYSGNSGLCGRPLDPCQGPRKKPNPFVGGFVFGWVLTTLLVSSVALLFFHDRLPPKTRQNLKIKINGSSNSKRSKNKNKQMQGTKHQNFGGNKDNKMSMFEKLGTRMSLTDILKATENFSKDNIIGWGKMGTMYRAMLANGWCLVVKRFQDSQHSERQFTKELTILSRARHVNLVPLLGFCTDTKEKLLVYKYMSNGNLHDWLHPLDGKASTLNWSSRMRIGIGLARGLAWLHHNCNPPIIHRNFNSKCILLDKYFEPKISNFNGSRIINSESKHSRIRPTSNSRFDNKIYDASDCTLIMLQKCDVYSFGVVLLELVTGEEPTKLSNASTSFDGNLVEWINHLSSTSSGLYDAVDKSLLGKGYDGEIFQLLRVAYNCVQSTPDYRPTMFEVYNNFKSSEDMYGFNANETSFQTEIVPAE